MTEGQQVGLAAGVLVPFVVAAMFIVSTAASTVSSMPFFMAAAILQIGGILLYFASAVGLFLTLTLVSRWRSNRTNWVAVAVFVATVATAAWYTFASWPLGVRYQGQAVTLSLGALNVGSAVAIGCALAHNTRRPTFGSALLANWWLTTWVFSWAFPYLGEYP